MARRRTSRSGVGCCGKSSPIFSNASGRNPLQPPAIRNPPQGGPNLDLAVAASCSPLYPSACRRTLGVRKSSTGNDMRIALTDRFVAGAKAGTRAEFFDSRVTGLALRVSPTAKSWAFHFTTAAGKRARLSLGPFPAITLAGARGLAMEAQAAVQAGQDPRTYRAAAMTVATLAENDLAKHVRPNLRSAKQVERRLCKNVVPVIGGVRLSDLHRRDINRVLDQIIGRGRPIEANRVFGDVRAMLRWAVARGDLDRDPVQGMDAPSPARSRDRVLNDAEIAKLWHALPTVLPRQVDCQRVLRLCLITGQRVGEVAGMRRDELDLNTRTWSLPGARTKNGHPHSVPLSDLAMSIIGQALADAGERSRLF